ncbi:unnamed protein product [Nyctereutes procyonoides]|uniref:(raccoon dog) hypothetical protein n=1 Tax=Nyctereutes procyonoides TaxID=34880 RepID=A0A811ZGI3_NYCPR|nr:unnamed protein product [Nyctereutes procyonoides]
MNGAVTGNKDWSSGCHCSFSSATRSNHVPFGNRPTPAPPAPRPCAHAPTSRKRDCSRLRRHYFPSSPAAPRSHVTRGQFRPGSERRSRVRTLSHVSEKEPLALPLPRLASAGRPSGAAEEEAAGGGGGRSSAAFPPAAARLLQPASPWMCEGERWARESPWTFPWPCGRRRAWEARGLLPRPLRGRIGPPERPAAAAEAGGRKLNNTCRRWTVYLELF